MDCHSELVPHSLGNNQLVQVVMHQCRQTAVIFPGPCDQTSCGILNMLQLFNDLLRCRGYTTDRFAFLSSLGATYDDHLGKRVVDSLLVLIELFSVGCTAEALRANIGSKSAISLQRAPVDTKFQVEGVALTNDSFSQEIRLNDLSYGIKI